jgi:hypothetical protein
VLTGLIGNGLALLLGAIALVAAKYRHDLPGRRTHDIVLTAAIIFMAFSGELARSTGVGRWIASVIRWAEHLIGPDASLVLAIIALVILVILARHIIKTAASSGLWLAFFFPFLLATFPVGFFHVLDLDLQGPAIQIAKQISTAFGA